MNFDINEARAIIEAAKQRGAIREAGSTQAPTPTPRTPALTPEEKAKEVVLPEWLRTGFNAPASDDKPGSPQWR